MPIYARTNSSRFDPKSRTLAARTPPRVIRWYMRTIRTRNTCSDSLTLSPRPDHKRIINTRRRASRHAAALRECDPRPSRLGPLVRPALDYRIPRIHEGDVLLVDGAGAIEVVLIEEGHDLVQIALVQLPRGY